MLSWLSPFNGENINAIMYQTLNAVPAPPYTLNIAVPEMLNFIVAKALAKKMEDRYQNAKDLAADLRACRDTMPRSSQSIDVSKRPAGGEKKLPDAISVTGGRHVDVEEVGAASTAKLSQAFDSGAATMKLAAMTASSEDVDELSKTLKIVRPAMGAINRAAPPAVNKAAKLPPVAARPGNEAAQSGSGGVLLAVIILALLGLVVFFVL
jgi:serine/threonine-protein kinase